MTRRQPVWPGRRRTIAVACLWLSLAGTAGCGDADEAGGPPDPESEAPDPIALALAAPARPPSDRERDGGRRPDAVLAYFGIEPGMTVLDLFSGGGYYTEIVSRIVGPTGRVLAHNNDAYLRYAAEEIAARYAEGRLGNVTRLDMPVADLSLEPGSVDVALLILAYHDIYFRPGDGSWPVIDGPGMLSLVYDALKPGGVLGVVDHAGNADITLAEIDRLHRIDEARVIREIEAAGFEPAGSSDVLRNPEDDHLRPMYDPQIRGRTDRFVLRFHKPD